MTKVSIFHVWVHVRHQKGRSWGGGASVYIYIYQKLCKSLSPFSHFVSKVRTIHVCRCHRLYQNTPCTGSRLTLLCSHKFRQTLTLWQTARTRTNTIVPRSAVDSSYPKDAHQQVSDVLLKTARNGYVPAIMITRKKTIDFFPAPDEKWQEDYALAVPGDATCQCTDSANGWLKILHIPIGNPFTMVQWVPLITGVWSWRERTSKLASEIINISSICWPVFTSRDTLQDASVVSKQSPAVEWGGEKMLCFTGSIANPPPPPSPNLMESLGPPALCQLCLRPYHHI